VAKGTFGLHRPRDITGPPANPDLDERIPLPTSAG